LEEGSSEGIKDVLEFDLVVNGSVKSNNTDIFFTSGLLGFGEAGGS
jgi:hypothetical protein